MVVALKKKKKRPVPFSVPLPDNLLRYIRAKAKSKKLSMSQTVRNIIQWEMELND
jgi:hypothetical protein